MLALTEIIESGIPEHRHQLPESLREYFQYHKGLSTMAPSYTKTVLSYHHH
ncbi:hypothetical protein DPMN_122544 [Dreissena polymorpha]|uniref:Uncharacterized protein n=1 Tax=Dreissena polymorpha TaxID=45954 RepID=A0A9D4GPL9_DREPO|nr:hypothetical protein DPMN_122544 [Dreissena polymorpha]